MRIIEVTWSMAFRVWWSFFWRAMLFSILGSFGIGFVLGIFGAVLGIKPVTGALSIILGMVFGFVVTFWAMKKVLYKRFSEFSVVCIANEPEPLQQSAAITTSDDDAAI